MFILGTIKDVVNNFPVFRNSCRRCTIKKAFLKISQNSQENTCIGASFLIKLQASDTVTFCEFLKILRTALFTDPLWWLLLNSFKATSFQSNWVATSAKQNYIIYVLISLILIKCILRQRI